MYNLTDVWSGTPDESIERFIESLLNTFKYWHNVHFDRDWWFDESFNEEIFGTSYNDLLTMHEENRNQGLHNLKGFDLRGIASKYTAVEMAENGEFDYCPECDNELETCFDAELLFDCGYCEEPTEENIKEALYNEGFDFYREYVSSHYGISPVKAHVEESIARIENALNGDDKFELLTVAIAATAVWHTNGNIMEDYGDRFELDCLDVDTLRNKSPLAIWGEDILNEFLDS